MKPSSPAHPSLQDEPLLTVQEAITLLHISRSGLYRLIKRGELPTVHVGYSLRLRARDVQAFLRGHEQVIAPNRESEPESD